MLIRNAPGIRSSEITPKDVYMNRRRFLATATLIGGGLAVKRARGHIRRPRQELAQYKREAYALPRRRQLQQLLRVRYQQGGARAKSENPPDVPLERVRRRRRGQAAHV